MEVVRFNKEIFGALIKCGFRHCYSKTVCDGLSTDQVNILLTPVGFEPDIFNLPGEFDTYFHIMEEPQQMIAGIDDNTIVYINLSDTILKEML